MNKWIFLLLISPALLVDNEYYDTLGVKRNATKSEIKKAFRKLSKKFHPDVYDGESSKYTDITEAYEVLSDDDTRRKYDRVGKEGMKNTPQNRQRDDFFGDFGDFFGGGGRGYEQEEKKGAELNIDIMVSLEDIFNGRDLEVVLTKNTICSHCRGSGADNPEDVDTCHKCKGRGVYMEVRQMGPGFVQQIQRTCPICKGKGKTFKSKCHVCGGKKLMSDLENFGVTIEKGVTDGHKIHLFNSANDYVDMKSSDLTFTVKTKKHVFYKREGKYNLKADVVLTLKEALLGFEKRVKHLDGSFFDVKSNGVTQPGETMLFKGKGLPQHDYPVERGNLTIEFKVELPESFSDKQNELWSRFFNS